MKVFLYCFKCHKIKKLTKSLQCRSCSMKGRKFTKKHKNNLSDSQKGRILSAEHKNKISETRIKLNLAKGINNPFYGKHHSKETKLKISQRKIKLQLHKGNKNGRWIDGRSYQPYTKEFRPLREQIRKRDNYICQKCYIKQQFHFINNKLEKLSIHHIDYNKHNCKENNLITLCRKCNSVVNHNRNKWKNYFIKILRRKYDI